MARNKACENWIAPLNSPHWWDRVAACDALGELGDVQAVTPLIRRLADELPFVRCAACRALGQLDDVRALRPLIERLGDEYSSVGRAACQALGNLGDLRAVDALIRRLGSGDSGVRQAACRALAKLGDRRAVEPLIERLGDQATDVRQAASRALGSIGVGIKDPHQLLCRACLARFQQEERRLHKVGKASVLVCRLCERAAHAIFDVTEVVAVLDTDMTLEFACADGVARVSYLKRDAPFDFDRVEIVRAGDYEVERFCVQVGNDADPFRKGRYRQMRCLVGPECWLSENTLRILRSMFCKVERRG